MRISQFHHKIAVFRKLDVKHWWCSGVGVSRGVEDDVLGDFESFCRIENS